VNWLETIFFRGSYRPILSCTVFLSWERGTVISCAVAL
jgi:hypothetical protein